MTTGQVVCLVLRHQIPAGAPAGAQEAVTVAAGFDYANAAPALAASVSVGDLTTATNGTLEVTKTVDLAAARPGDLITYTITYSNPGPDPVSAIVIQDATPPWTVFVGGSCTGMGAGLTGCALTTGSTARPSRVSDVSAMA